jgi:hypothetical protein
LTYCLALKDDKIFIYKHQDYCFILKSYSGRNWKQVDDTLILISFEPYKQLEKENYILSTIHDENDSIKNKGRIQLTFKKAKMMDDIYIANWKYILMRSGLVGVDSSYIEYSI